MSSAKHHRLLSLLLVAFPFVAIHAQSKGSIRINGRIASEDPDQVTTVFVRDASGEIMWAKRPKNGAFRFDLPMGGSYRIGFTQPGALDKEVEIDTQHAKRYGARTRSQTIRFTVVMESDPDQGCAPYAGAVGNLKFHHSNGRMQVQHDYTKLDGTEEEQEP